MYSSAYVWAKILGYMEERLGSVTVSAWLDDAEVVELNDSHLILYSPSDFRRDIIRRRCADYIQDALKEIFNSEAKLLVFGDEERDTFRNRHKVSSMDFNPQFSFENFVVGPSNRFAHSAAIAVSKTPGQVYNPLFIYGPPGVGKTHLLYAIANGIRRDNPNANVVYIKGDEFTNELIAAIQNGKNIEFRSKYREADLFLIDDVQFIAGKEQTQEEFFWTFNTLHDAKKQIIISADRPPKDIEGIADRLVSRFEWGLVTDIQPPDLETRVAILQKKAEMKKYMNIPEDVIMFIAQNIPSNIRELEGSLNRIVACSDLNHEPINIENASVWLKDLIKEHPLGTVSIGLIQQLTAESFGFTVEELLSKKRTADLALARQAAMYVARNKTNEALIQIAYAFNKKDHTVVIHACKKIAELIKTDLRVRSFVDNIVNKL